jgi:hypothetical protein
MQVFPPNADLAGGPAADLKTQANVCHPSIHATTMLTSQVTHTERLQLLPAAQLYRPSPAGQCWRSAR